MPRRRKSSTLKTLENTSSRCQVSVFLDPEEVEAVKAISIAKDWTLSGVITTLMRKGLKDGEYNDIIQAYQQFKNKVG